MTRSTECGKRERDKETKQRRKKKKKKRGGEGIRGQLACFAEEGGDVAIVEATAVAAASGEGGRGAADVALCCTSRVHLREGRLAEPTRWR